MASEAGGAAARARRARRLWRLAVVAAAGFVLLYVVAVLTAPGQRADRAAIRGGDRAVATVPQPVRERGRSLLSTVSVGSLAAAVAALGGFALVRRRPRLILVPVAVVGASLVATELLKHLLLYRPELIDDGLIPDNSYPSGHTTIAISLGLSAILVAPARLRAAAAVAAAVLAAGMGVLVVAGAWHRPSDPLGSFALTVAIAAAIAARLLPRVPEVAALDEFATRRAPGVSGLELAALGTGIAVFLGSILFATLRFGAEVDWTVADAAFLASIAAIIAFAGIAVGSFARALGVGTFGLEPKRRGAR